jgi:hypothetical protein
MKRGDVVQFVVRTRLHSLTSWRHVATIQCHESVCLWQIMVVQNGAMEFFCPSKEVVICSLERGIRSQDRISAINLARNSDARTQFGGTSVTETFGGRMNHICH